MNLHKIVTTLALTIAVAVGVSGCAGTADSQPDSQSDTSAASTAPTAEAEVTPGAAAGAYVDYSDGIVAKTAGTKVLFFYAPWCPNCRALEKDINASPIPAGLTIIKVDFDTATELRQKYGVTLQTTVVYVDDDGSELGKKILAEDPSLDALVAASP